MAVTYKPREYQEHKTTETFTRRYSVVGAPVFKEEGWNDFQPVHVTVQWERISYTVDEPGAWFASVLLQGPRLLASGRHSQRFHESFAFDDDHGLYAVSTMPEWLGPLYLEASMAYAAWLNSR